MRILFALLALAPSLALAADVPVTLVHEGRLLDASDQPVDAAALAMRFEIFVEKLADTGQTPVWSADCTVQVSHGNYAVTLGGDCGTALTTEALPLDAARYLQVTVDGAALEPRLLLGVVPAAAEAGDALTVGGLAPAAFWQKTEAVDAATLGGSAPDQFWAKSDAVDAATLGGSAPDQFWTKSDAVDAATLGGSAPDQFWTKSDAVDAATLGGSAAGQFWQKSDAVDAATLGGESLAQLEAANDARYVQSSGGGAVTISGSVQAASFSGDGSALTNLDAGALASGVVADARLPADLSRTDVAQTFTKAQTFGALTAASVVATGSVRVGNDSAACTDANAGALRFTGTALELCSDGAWTAVAVARLGSSASHAGTSCKAILDAGGSVGDGVYWIDPDGAGATSPMQVWCDMTTDGGGWTRCLSAHWWGSAKPQGWTKNGWLSSRWSTGTSSVLDDSISGANFGNFCTLLASASTEVYGEATYATATPTVKTAALSLPADLFASGSEARTTGSGTNAIAVDANLQGRYGAACANTYTGGVTQGIQSLCINDASHQQTMHTGWPNGAEPGSCPDSATEPCFCSQDNYCGGTDANEDRIVMTLYVR